MEKTQQAFFFIMAFVLFLTAGCKQDYSPKPRGYLRIEFPEKSYIRFDSLSCPFSFDIPVYSRMEPDQNRFSQPCWLNLVFDRYKGAINLSYKPVEGNLNKFLEDSRTLAYKHTVKADGIDEKLVNNPVDKVYGLIYEISGDAASSLQFYLTDSSKHFIRGALYFNVPPKSDSLAPVINFIKSDIYHLVKTFKWK